VRLEHAAVMRIGGNDYDAREVSGAFGDLGTLIPFVVGYLAINGLDPVGILVNIGLFQVAAGLYFRTPVPVQPMKAIGAQAIAHAATITPGAIWASGLFTGVVWLVLGLTGAVTWIARVTGRPVVQGLVLGLGLSFVLQGARMMEGDFVLGIMATLLTFLLLSRGRVPALLVTVGLGVAIGAVRASEGAIVWEVLTPHFRLPDFGLARIGWDDAVTGILVLGLPQVALTLGNAILATAEENNALFPDRQVTVRALAVDHGIMNLVGATLAGVPMCHGAGGMAAHVRFGARTGGALVILGTGLLVAGFFFADGLTMVFRLFPGAILGAILLFGGLELAAGTQTGSATREDRYVLLLTAGVAMWNMGAGYFAGLVLWHLFRREWLRA
jgi:MFS superfamily sulfate permease-like transporter